MQPRLTTGPGPDRPAVPPAARRERRRTPGELLARIEAFGLSPADTPLAFETKLADAQGWTLGHALAVTAEYRRFLVLTQLAGHPVSPSPDVDEAWHQHLTHTAHYERLCLEVFGRFLHHEPAGEGASELERLRGMVESTRTAYRHAFGADPPEAVWPRRGHPLPSAPAPLRRWTVPRLLQPANGLGWACFVAAFALCLLPGARDVLSSPMLSFGGFLLIAVAMAGLMAWLDAWTRDRARTPHPRDVLEPCEVAWFGGGAARMAMTGMVMLVDRGVLRQPAEADQAGLPRGALAVDRGSPASARHPVEAACLRAAHGAGLTFGQACQAVKPLADACERRLMAAGLLAERGTMPLGRARALLPFTLWLAVCFERCLVEMQAQRASAVLALGVAVVSVVLFLRLASRPPRVAGRAAQSLKVLSAWHRHTRSTRRVGDALALGVALGGTGVFANDPRFAGLAGEFGALGLPARQLARQKAQEEADGGSGFGVPSGLGSMFESLLGASCGSPGVSSCGSGASGGGGSWDAGGALDLGGGSSTSGGGSSCSGGSSCGSSCSGGSSCSSGSSCGGGGSSD